MRGNVFCCWRFCCRSPSEAFDAALYDKCVEACALEQDFAEWAERDLSIIGAKGETRETAQANTIDHDRRWSF